MHDESDDDLPYDRPGVAPVWRWIGIAGLLAAAGLLALALGLMISLAAQTNGSVNNGWGMVPPAPGVAAVGADVVAADDALELQGNLPYPVQQDLRPEGTFPVPGDPGRPLERHAPSPRQVFYQAAAVVWTNSDPEAPDRVLISPDGADMAYVSDAGLMVGPRGAPELIGDNGPVAAPGWGRRPPGGMVGGMGGAGAVARSTGERPRPLLCGWSRVEPVRVIWSDGSGRIRVYTPQAQKMERSRVQAEFALSLPAAVGEPERQLAVRIVSRPKTSGTGVQAAPDLTELVAVDNTGVPIPHPGLGKTIRPGRIASLALSPDGKQLALEQGLPDGDKGTLRWRVVVSSMETGAEVCASPPSTRCAGVCWTPDSKVIIYARSQTPVPADHSPRLLKDSCNLYRFEVETKKETRLSRGGGFTSPSMTDKGELCFLSQTPQAGAPLLVELMSMMLTKADEVVRDQEEATRDLNKHWQARADTGLKKAGVPPKPDASHLKPEDLKKLAGAFADQVAAAEEEGPLDLATLNRQREEIASLELAPPDQARFVLLLGAAEGENLRGQVKGSSWLLGPGALDTAVTGENPFAVAFNPFRPLHSRPAAEASLAEVLFRAEGRPLLLSNDPAAVKVALEKQVDPDLARGTILLQNDKGDEADRVLLDLMKRHSGNHYLVRQVGTLLQQHGRGKALADLLQPLCDQLDAGAFALPRDAHLYNLMGITLMDASPNRGITAFQDALRCDLKYGPAYLNLAQSYEAVKQTSDARLTLRRYLKLFPEGELAADARRRLRIAGDDNGP